jgi:hypothetical protein
MGMRDSYPYPGRHLAPYDTEPDFIRPDEGNVICLVVRVAEFEVVSLYAEQATINLWGIRLIKPFRRLSKSNMRHEFAEYLGKDIHVFCPARLQIVPMEVWMLRGG